MTRHEAENYVSKKMSQIANLANATRKAPRRSGVVASNLVGSVIQNQWFEICIACVVLCNALLMGFQADWQIKHASLAAPPVYHVLDLTCTVLFTLELILRLVGEQKHFLSWHNPDFGWNVFDAGLVMLALINEVVQIVASAPANMSFVRLFRTLRLARVLKMIRLVKMLNDLRVMVAGILSSLKPLAWALLLLGIIMYVFSVCVLQFVAERVTNLPAEDTDAVELRQFYSSLTHTMRTLWMSISGGVDWGDASRPLGDIHSLLEGAFILYVAFALLCVLNIVTGVFVENANKSYRADEAHLMLEDAQSRKQVMENMRHFLGGRYGRLW